MEMKSKAELTPAERLLNLCSLCLMPPMIIQIPCAGGHTELSLCSLPRKNRQNEFLMTQTARLSCFWPLTGMKSIHPSKVPVSAAFTTSS